MSTTRIHDDKEVVPDESNVTVVSVCDAQLIGMDLPNAGD